MRSKNLAISKKRANIVKNYLVNKEVNPESFVIVAVERKKPKYYNCTKSGQAKTVVLK